MLERFENSQGLVVYRSPLLDSVGVPHAFSTRLGGVSPKPFDTLNFQPADSDVSHLKSPDDVSVADVEIDDYACVQTNMARLAAAIGREGVPVSCIWQVHGAASVVVPDDVTTHSSRSPRVVAKADAIITADSGQLVAIRVADCVPILLADESGRWVAAVHAGWRGVVDGAAVEAVKRMCMLAGIEPARLSAAIGPCISVEHFEVGHEVAQAFVDADLGDAVDERSPRPHIDLPGAVSQQLMRVGLLRERIDRTDRCTFRDEQEFFSHRRDHGRTGRLCAIIGCSDTNR